VSRPFLQRKRTWIAVAILAGAALAALHRSEIAAALQRLDWRDVQTAVRAAGPWAPLLCIALNALFTMLFLPTTLVVILVALLYGITRGLPICLAGLALGMAGSFLVSRYLARDWIERRIGHTRLFRRLEENMRSEGWKLVFFTRLLPINPYGFLNYAYGLTRVAFGPYVVASTFGVVPNVLALMWTAKAAGKIARGQMDWRVLAILFAGAGLFAVLAWLPKLLRRRGRLVALPDADEPEEDEA
jgi:uncharacterized membrane protein YdjX (TVP38/TMEM64 family)